MAIRLRQPGVLSAFAGLGRLAGEAEAAKRQQAIAARQMEQIRAHQFDMQRRELDWQWELEKYNQAKAWEIERMRANSQLEWEREQKRYQREMDERDAKLRAIEKEREAGHISAGDAEKARLEIETNIPFYSRGVLQERQQQAILERAQLSKKSDPLDLAFQEAIQTSLEKPASKAEFQEQVRRRKQTMGTQAALEYYNQYAPEFGLPVQASPGGQPTAFSPQPQPTTQPVAKPEIRYSERGYPLVQQGWFNKYDLEITPELQEYYRQPWYKIPVSQLAFRRQLQKMGLI